MSKCRVPQQQEERGVPRARVRVFSVAGRPELVAHVPAGASVSELHETQGPARALTRSEAYRLMKLGSFLCEEYVGRPGEDGRTPVTLRIIGLTEQHMASVAEATFRTPMLLHRDLDRMHGDLQRTIRLWLRAKEVINDEQRVIGSERATAVRLSCYRADEFATTYAGRAVFLVGDAAFGVPFFRALNNGLLCGTQLAQSVRDVLREPQDAQHTRAQWRYNMAVSMRSDREIGAATVKKAGLVLGEVAVRFNASLPWQLVKFSKDVLRRIQDVPPVFLSPDTPSGDRPAAAAQGDFCPDDFA